MLRCGMAPVCVDIETLDHTGTVLSERTLQRFQHGLREGPPGILEIVG